MSASSAQPVVPWEEGNAPDPTLTEAEREVLDRIASHVHSTLQPPARALLDRLADPIDAVSAGWPSARARKARNYVLAEVQRRGTAYWAWDEDTWFETITTKGDALSHARFEVVALAYVFGGHHRLHHRVGLMHLSKFADLVFGKSAVEPAMGEVLATLRRWKASENALSQGIVNATLDLLLSCGSPRLADITDDVLLAVVRDHREGRRASRRSGLVKLSRVLADKGIISGPLTSNYHNQGPKPETLATVPDEWLDWAQRWRKLATCAPGTLRSRWSVILIAGRWAAEKHPDAIGPDKWTRDMAAEYVADTMQARIGQWTGHNRNNTRWGEPISVPGMANRIDSLRAFFCDLIDWEWLKPRFDPRRVISLPLSVRAGLGPKPEDHR